MRRLAAGDFTPEEEAELRKRLAEIAAERGELLAAMEAALQELLASGNLTEEERAALEAKLKALGGAKATNELGLMKATLAALDDEEAKLLRRLAAGDLSPGEAAAIRARLSEIAREREALIEKICQAEILAKQNEMADIYAQLSALDDEEAELFRQMAAGDLTPEEEAEIRKRVAEIAAEQGALLAKRADVAVQLERADDAAAEAAAAALLANAPPGEEYGPLGGRPVYSAGCPAADNMRTGIIRASWVRKRGADGSTSMSPIHSKVRGGMNSLKDVSARAKIVSCRHCLHGLCPQCRKDQGDTRRGKREKRHENLRDTLVRRTSPSPPPGLESSLGRSLVLTDTIRRTASDPNFIGESGSPGLATSVSSPMLAAAAGNRGTRMAALKMASPQKSSSNVL